MSVERVAGGNASKAEVLDRVLDKGIVIDAWVRVSLGGIELITVDASVVVASISTYLEKWDELAQANTLPGLRRPTTSPAGHRPRKWDVERCGLGRERSVTFIS